MEKLVTGQPPVNVTATLVSPNPAAFAITPMMRTEVPFRFAVDGGVIDMSQGYDITIDIDELTTSIVTMPSSLTLSEGTSATIAVRLSSAPPAPVAVAIASSDTSAVVATPATLTFTPANFALPQVVTVTAVQDMDNANEMVTLALTSAGIPAASVAIIVNDDDVQTIVATPTNLSILENNFGNFSVRLAAQPAANVTVQAISSDTSAVVVTPSTLTFTAANYATNQFVTANAIHDPDLLDELVQVMLVSPGAPSALVTVHVNDID